MSATISNWGMAIDSPLVLPTSENYRLPSWPPPNDFPVVVDSNGKVVSHYGDTIWNLTPWAKQSLRLNFGDNAQRKDDPITTPVNANLARQVAAWWLWGPYAVRSAASLKARFVSLFPLFTLCSEEGIAASDLWKFPRVADKLTTVVSPSNAVEALTHLHALFEQRDQLGFTILDREGLRRFEAAIPEHQAKQTPYIPPRIWAYQVDRLRKFLDEFHKHRENIEACYRFCLDKYAKYYGSLGEACHRSQHANKSQPSPFHPRNRDALTEEFEYEGRFSSIAQRFGISELLRRWVLQPGQSLDSAGRSTVTLSSYFTMVGKVGTAYILNFSMMRIEEAWALRTNCLEVEKDESFGNVYLLRGVTTKTVEDDDARWITSPFTEIAVEAMACVTRLRMICAEANRNVPTTSEDAKYPYLVVRPYEPWANAKNTDEPLYVRPVYPSYQTVIQSYPNLFDPEELRITEADLQIARLVTTTLDEDVFVVGKIWPLAWHQLRRTGAVNMLASGLVSDASVQYQLKHATRVMSLYYGQGYSRVRLNDDSRTHYIRTMYEVLSKEIVLLFSDRFISPYGDNRKSEILRVVDPNDAKKLGKAARAGQVSWRQTLLGGCTKRGPCEYGGVDNVIRCGGGDKQGPCADALFDRNKEQSIRQLARVIDSRLIDAPLNSPYRESLHAQQRAVENAIDVISIS
ncbi:MULTISPECIES: hypothetical protein [unclassified Pseudomonas]|uniref:hypothetical protein n=1 Tax=unclassified Pseudomonas TaxID=196821 RepID=UPI002118E58A|nr:MULTISPECIES: hypothetical protein [unclassified Pseudomonas]